MSRITHYAIRDLHAIEPDHEHPGTTDVIVKTDAGRVYYSEDVYGSPEHAAEFAQALPLDLDYWRENVLTGPALLGCADYTWVELTPAPRWIAGTNIPGYMPDSEPQECETQDEAKRGVIGWLKAEEDCVETEEEAETLAAFAEDVNLQSGEFSAQCLGCVYWVTLA